MIVKGDKFLILRYSNGIYDCIKNHMAVLDTYGYCWFGKIGAVPSEKALREKLNAEKTLVVLYCQGAAFLCRLLEVSTTRPLEGYPLYYQQFMFDRDIYPKMYFKLASIEKFPKDIFGRCVALSSRRPITETVSRSMASFFYGEYPTDDGSTTHLIDFHDENKISKQRSNNMIIEKNSCVYKEDGICTCKRCINYGYECRRPNSCKKQKPRVIEGI